MKILLYKIPQVIEGLKEIGKEKTPIKISYNIARNTSSLMTAYDEYVKQINSIIDECGQKDEEGNILRDENSNIKIVPEKIEETNKKIEELNLIEEEIELRTFKLSDFDSFEISAEALEKIMILIEE